jgi:hypothetical protein
MINSITVLSSLFAPLLDGLCPRRNPVILLCGTHTTHVLGVSERAGLDPDGPTCGCSTAESEDEDRQRERDVFISILLILSLWVLSLPLSLPLSGPPHGDTTLLG